MKRIRKMRTCIFSPHLAAGFIYLALSLMRTANFIFYRKNLLQNIIIGGKGIIVKMFNISTNYFAVYIFRFSYGKSSNHN